MSYATVFYAGMLHSEVDYIKSGFTLDLPEGVYIYFDRSQYSKKTWAFGYNGWYLKDLTPVLLQDVPKELLVLKLLLT